MESQRKVSVSSDESAHTRVVELLLGEFGKTLEELLQLGPILLSIEVL